MCIHAYVHKPAAMAYLPELRGQFMGVSSLLLPCGVWGSNSDPQFKYFYLLNNLPSAFLNDFCQTTVKAENY